MTAKSYVLMLSTLLSSQAAAQASVSLRTCSLRLFPGLILLPDCSQYRAQGICSVSMVMFSIFSGYMVPKASIPNVSADFRYLALLQLASARLVGLNSCDADGSGLDLAVLFVVLPAVDQGSGDPTSLCCGAVGREC